MIAYQYNEKGEYVRPVIVNGQLPENCTWTAPPLPNWKPVYANGVWTETATEEEKAPKVEKTQLEILQETVDQLVLDNLLGGM
jgi:hypothetical protein